MTHPDGGLSASKGRYLAIYWPMLHRRGPIRSVTHDSMDTAQFLFSFESDLPETVPRHLSGGLQEWGGQVSQKTLATPVFIGQNESCPLLKVPPCHDTKSRTDWPVNWCYRYLSSTNLPVFVNLPYPTMKVRSWLFSALARWFLLSEGWGRIWTRYNSMASVGNPATILLVDDDEALRRFARHILMQQGFHVIEASDGAEALEVASAYAHC